MYIYTTVINPFRADGGNWRWVKQRVKFYFNVLMTYFYKKKKMKRVDDKIKKHY